MNYITSSANPRIKTLSQLSKTRGRRQTGHILIEGSREIELAVRYGWELLEVYYCPDLYQGPLPTAPQSFNISREALNKINDGNSVASIARYFHISRQTIMRIRDCVPE